MREALQVKEKMSGRVEMVHITRNPYQVVHLNMPLPQKNRKRKTHPPPPARRKPSQASAKRRRSAGRKPGADAPLG